MANTYIIGASTNQILLTAKIKAFGSTAASRAIYLLLSDPADLGTEVAVSTDATGNINSKKIGDYTTLKGKRLSVVTLLSVTGASMPARQTTANNITATYTLDKGDDGLKTYSLPFKSINADATGVTLTFNIDLQ